MRILIIGGYGVFGGRLARLLADEPRARVIVAGRSLDKARAAAGPDQEAAVFDRNGDIAAQLAAIGPEIVVDASGPFQGYGAEPYRVIEGCIAAGVSYVDLADGADFVASVARFDEAAKAAGVFVISGASTCPALTSAVARELSKGLDSVYAIAAGIAPSPYAGVGLNVVKAIAAYAGKPLRLRSNGRERQKTALVDSLRYTIAPPGADPMAHIRFSLVDVPDLKLLPTLWPQVRTVWFGAGPTPAILHRLLSVMAGLVRLRLLPSLVPFAPLFHWVLNRLRWGRPRGGMFVRVSGYAKRNRAVEHSWHLIAEGDDGPNIPAMAAEALVRRSLDGAPPAPGARACLRELDLADFDKGFSRFAITTGRREAADANLDRPLFRRLLGEAYERLAPTLQAMHDPVAPVAVDGVAQVERGGHPLAWFAGLVFGLPRAGSDVPVTVGFIPRGGGEVWRRIFAGKSFRSLLTEGRGAWQYLACERFGVMRVGMALVVEDGRLAYRVQCWSLLGIPMPAWLAPGGDSYEYEEDGRFHFHVEMRHPLCGLIVRYRGWLVPRT